MFRPFEVRLEYLFVVTLFRMCHIAGDICEKLKFHQNLISVSVRCSKSHLTVLHSQ